jgi:hypothetical protein
VADTAKALFSTIPMYISQQLVPNIDHCHMVSCPNEISSYNEDEPSGYKFHNLESPNEYQCVWIYWIWRGTFFLKEQNKEKTQN